jgi:hypothetical protein
VRFLASKNELSSRLDSMPWRRRHCVVEQVVEIAGHVNVIHPRQLSISCQPLAAIRRVRRQGKTKWLPSG